MRFIVLLFLLAKCIFASDIAVRYVHLAMTTQNTEMVVGWYTQDSAPSKAAYGLQSGKYTYNVTGYSNYWKQGYGNNHFATLTNLKPATKYYYICGTDGAWSKESSFVTPPDTKVPFTIAVYGDMGVYNSGPTIQGVIDLTEKGAINWVYHIGDLAYADDNSDFQKTWNDWAGSVEPISSKIPYMVLPGNHEYEAQNQTDLNPATRNFVVYNHRYLTPHATSESQNMYYSFDYSNVHFVSYSTETSFKDAPYGDASNFGDQLAWLEQDLITANLPENRKLRPWIIVCGHRPIYSSAVGYSQDGKPINHPHGPPSNSLTLQQTFEALFTKYKVDLMFNGHVHSYERNYPAYDSKRTSGYVNPKSPMNIVIGNAGNVEGLENLEPSSWTMPQPEWSAYRYGKGYGYGALHVINDTHLNWKLYRAEDGGIQDEFTLINEHL